MKLLMVVIALGLVALAAARPNFIFKFEGENARHEQEGVPGVAVNGEYWWLSPEGGEYEVKYIADEKGYRLTKYTVQPAAPVFRPELLPPAPPVPEDPSAPLAIDIRSRE